MSAGLQGAWMRPPSLRRLASVAFLLAALSPTAVVADDRPVLRDDLDGLIHDYLMAHPEVIAEAQKALLARRAHDVIAENKAALYADADSSVIGNPRGDVTIVEFFDDECPFCKLLAPTLNELIARDKNVRVILTEFPILGPGSEIAARYALASKKQGRYPAFHAALMADKSPEHSLTEAHILDIAGTLGLDVTRLKQDAQAPEIIFTLNRNRTLGKTIGFSGTPGLVIGETALSGAPPLDALVQAVASARAAQSSSQKSDQF